MNILFNKHYDLNFHHNYSTELTIYLTVNSNLAPIFQLTSVGTDPEPACTPSPPSLLPGGAPFSVPATVCYEGEGNGKYDRSKSLNSNGLNFKISLKCLL